MMFSTIFLSIFFAGILRAVPRSILSCLVECVNLCCYFTWRNVTIISSISERFAWFMSCGFIGDRCVKTSTSWRMKAVPLWSDWRWRSKWKWSASFDCPSTSFTQPRPYQAAGFGAESSLITRLVSLAPLPVASDSISILPKKDSLKISEDIVSIFIPLVECLWLNM